MADNNISRREFLGRSIFASAALSMPLASCRFQKAEPSLKTAEEGLGSKTNVVVLLIDDLGYGDVGAFGCSDIPTPNMDKLAARGVKCTNSYITNPPCSPSRCSLMMGMYGQRFGKYGMARGLAIPEDKPTLAEFMRDAGYVTGMIGKWDIGSREQSPMKRGFMEVARSAPAKDKKAFVCVKEDGSEGWRTEMDGDRMVEFVERNKDNPFFLYFSPRAVHSPSSETPERLRKRTTAKGKRRALAGAIVSVDDQVGKLLTVLKKHKLEKNTLIYLTGDNGPNLGEGGSAAPYRGGKVKGTQQEGWVHTPAIVSFPGTIPQGKTYDGLMCTLDVYATAAAVAGKPLPKDCDGVNFLPYLQGKKQGDVHERLFWLNSDPKDPVHRHLTVVRWKNWRLIKDKTDGRWKLYNLKTDPREEKDLAGDHADVVADMSRHHAAWAKTLAPMIPTNTKGDGRQTGGIMPKGYGWVFTEPD
jgi:arylsulfatase A-like enzyme